MTAPNLVDSSIEPPVGKNWNDELREPRIGIMLHYDGSLRDPAAVNWLLRDPRCKVSYNWIILDDGKLVPIAPQTARAWHAGVCRSSDPVLLSYKDANSAFYGLSIAATAGDKVTQVQLLAVVSACHFIYAAQRWSPKTDSFRVVGHQTEAWPRGRKNDPIGPDLQNPVMDPAEVRRLIQGGTL